MTPPFEIEHVLRRQEGLGSDFQDALSETEHELQALDEYMQAYLDSATSNSLFDAPPEIQALYEELLEAGGKYIEAVCALRHLCLPHRPCHAL